jgi:hypothetical protein
MAGFFRFGIPTLELGQSAWSGEGKVRQPNQAFLMPLETGHFYHAHSFSLP